MKRINIKTSLIFWDIITFIVVFISTYLMFEVVIKNIISNSSNTDFYEQLNSMEVEYFNSLDYLEKKDTLVYEDYIDDILGYSIKAGVNRTKYDDSLFIILTDLKDTPIKSGKKNDPNYILTDSEIDFDAIKILASHIPKSVTREEYTALNTSIKNSEDRDYFRNLYDLDGELYKLNRIPDIYDRNRYYQMFNDGNYISNKTISFEFSFKNREYIGIAEYAKHGIYTDNKTDITYPIFIVADLRSDFFYLINKVRNTFLFILFFVFILVVIIKLITTSKITTEIGSISRVITQEGENIRIRGLVKKSVKRIQTDFKETAILYDSYANLHQRLNQLGEIVSGISDKELLTAVLMETKSVLDPHEEHMSVMFLDIKGFTTLTEKYQEKVFTIVNTIWFEVEKIVEKNYGKINKYIGDACLIIFQENKGKYNSSFYALKSSILVLEKVRELQKELEIDFNFRVGIDYGQIVYGKTGTENNYELGVIGDTVNTAARLEAINKQYKTNILMTETVVERTKEELKKLNPSLHFYKVDKVRPKGKRVPKELFTVLANNGKHSRFLGSDKYLKNSNLGQIQLIMDSFTNGISLWQDYSKAKTAKEARERKVEAHNKWSDTLILIKEAYKREQIPTMEKYISRLITVTEYEEYKTNQESWFNKDYHQIQEPSEDWIKYGFIEIEK